MPIVYIYTEWYKSQPPEFEQRFPHIFAGVVMSMQLDGAMAGPMAELPAAPRRKTLRQRLRGPLMAAFPTALIFVGGGAYLADEPYVSTDNAFVRAAQDSINARVAGQVVEIAVEDNQPGHKWQLLFRIDPAPYQIAVETEAWEEQPNGSVRISPRDGRKQLSIR